MPERKIQCETFLRAPFKRRGQRTIETANVRELISNKSMRKLLSLNGHNKLHHNLLPENIIAITQTVTVKDDMDRDVTRNHTFLITVADYFSLHKTRDIAIFGPHFLNLNEKPPRQLEPLRIEPK